MVIVNLLICCIKLFFFLIGVLALLSLGGLEGLGSEEQWGQELQGSCMAMALGGGHLG